MTSETTEKEPIIVTPFGRRQPDTYFSYSGLIIVFLTWCYLYFSCIGTLYDGLQSFLWSSDDRIHVLSGAVMNVAVTAATEILANAPVEFGSGKYYALCGVGGILSCGRVLIFWGFIRYFSRYYPHRHCAVGFGQVPYPGKLRCDLGYLKIIHGFCNF